MTNKKDRTRNGLLQWDDEKQIITIKRRLSPLLAHGHFVKRLRTEYPDYQVIDDHHE